MLSRVDGQLVTEVLANLSVPSSRDNMGPIGCPETSVTTNLRCVTFQNNDYLIYKAAEA